VPLRTGGVKRQIGSTFTFADVHLAFVAGSGGEPVPISPRSGKYPDLRPTLDPRYITAIAHDDPAERAWLEGEAGLLSKRPPPPRLPSPKGPSDRGCRR
jgi:hypothetical protein